MDVRLDDSWKVFLDREIAQGRFESANAAVAEGLRLVAEREAKIREMRASLEDAIAQGGEVTEKAIDAAIEARAAELRRMGYAD